jgi:hypothetical protein
MKNIKLVLLITLICCKPVCADESNSNSKSSLMYFFSLDEETREKLSQSFGNSSNSKPDNYSDKKIIITQTPKLIDSKITVAPINNNISADLELINKVDSIYSVRIDGEARAGLNCDYSLWSAIAAGHHDELYRRLGKL